MNILITCEGVRTEPNYLQALLGELSLPGVTTSILGKGMSSCRLISETIKLRKKRAEDEEHPVTYDEVWAVFDRDDNQDFNQALALARQNGICCAWSNESIELWFLLHFEFVNTNNGRRWYIHKLNRIMRRLTGDERFKYRKNSTTFYHLLQRYGDERKAARWSRMLEARWADCDYAHHDPMTTMYRLVEHLRGLAAQNNAIKT